MKAYLAGPMSGIPQFNFPEFHRVTAILRMQGWEVVSPAELDDPEDREAALASADGAQAADGTHAHTKKTWGDYLSRDVKLIADAGIEAIILLPMWDRSKGAVLEATVGLLKLGTRFFEWNGGTQLAVEVESQEIAAAIYMWHIEKLIPEGDVYELL